MFIRRFRLENEEGDELKGGAGGEAAGAAGEGEGAGEAGTAGGSGTGEGAAGNGAAAAGGDGAGEGEGKGGEGSPSWPEDWRDRMAGEDEKLRKQLDRYTTPEAAGKALRAAQERISEGFKPDPFPDKGTDEQKAEWRQANGIPDKSDAYIENVDDGIVIGEEDAELFKSFAEHAHGINMPQEQFNAVAKWYQDMAEQRESAIQEQDETHKTEVSDTLTTELGPQEYRANLGNLKQVLDAHLPSDAVEALLNARLGDGRGVFNHTGIVKGLFEMARLVNPVHSPVGGGNRPGQSIDDRLEEIKEKKDKMGYDAWMKDEGLRKEQRELIEAKNRQNAA